MNNQPAPSRPARAARGPVSPPHVLSALPLAQLAVSMATCSATGVGWAEAVNSQPSEGTQAEVEESGWGCGKYSWGQSRGLGREHTQQGRAGLAQPSVISGPGWQLSPLRASTEATAPGSQLGRVRPPGDQARREGCGLG